MKPDPDTAEIERLLTYPEDVNPYIYLLIVTVGLTPKEIDEMDLEDLGTLAKCRIADNVNKASVQKYYAEKMKKPTRK